MIILSDRLLVAQPEGRTSPFQKKKKKEINRKKNKKKKKKEINDFYVTDGI